MDEYDFVEMPSGAAFIVYKRSGFVFLSVYIHVYNLPIEDPKPNLNTPYGHLSSFVFLKVQKHQKMLIL